MDVIIYDNYERRKTAYSFEICFSHIGSMWRIVVAHISEICFYFMTVMIIIYNILNICNLI